ncbi:M20 family metallopeptidase [soil metagenome]
MTDESAERRARLLAAVEAQRETVLATTRFVHEHPELAHEEVQSAAALTQALGSEFVVQQPFAGMATAFRATLFGSAPGPTIGLVAVYDAVGVATADGSLIGQHSCGHGPISGGVVGAARALAAVKHDLAGSIVVLGLPADELVSPRAVTEGSGKAVALAAGGLDDIDIVLFAHPESPGGVWRSSRWMQLFEATVDAGSDPASWELPFDRFRIDGVIRGDRSDVVIVRVLGDDGDEITQRADEARARIRPLEWTALALTEGLRADAAVATTVEAVLAQRGIPFEAETPRMPFSTDFGTVSRRIPGAMIGISREGGWAVHTEEGERQFHSADGDRLAETIAEVLALTAFALLADAAHTRNGVRA